MPRRRVTKAMSQRSRPKLPEGDEGKDLSEIERKEKLRIFLADFDIEMNEKLRGLEDMKRQLLMEVDVRFHALISQIPVPVRKMPMKDFIASGGTITTALRWLQQEDDPSITDDSFSVKPLNKKGRAARLDSILEDTPATTRTMAPPTSTVKRPIRSKRTTKAQSSKTNGSERPSTSSKYKTPARGPNCTGWETPLFTPRFDPKLPTTPEGERAPKPGERLVSKDGSPVCIKPNKRMKSSFIPVTNGKTVVGHAMLQLPDLPEDMELLPNFDDNTDLNIQKLHAMLSSYLQKTGSS